jgi:hypothetical protein
MLLQTRTHDLGHKFTHVKRTNGLWYAVINVRSKIMHLLYFLRTGSELYRLNTVL